MNPLIDEDLRFLLHSASSVLEDVDPKFEREFSRDEFPKWSRKDCPPSEWTNALKRAYEQATAWLETGNYEARYIARHTEIIARLNDRFAGVPFNESGSYHRDLHRHYDYIGEIVSKSLLNGDVNVLKALWDLAKRWKGETREVNPKPLQLTVIQEAFTLWRTLKRNPTRAELRAACGARGICFESESNWRSMLKKTGLQFLA